MSYSEKDSHRDAIDLILAGAKTIQTVTKQSGETETVEMPDAETIYYMTRNVNSLEFSNFVFQLKMLESLADQAPYCMSGPRASVIMGQIMSVIKACKSGIDAKSSETLRAKGEKQSTLIDKLVHTRETKELKVNDASRKSNMIQSFFTGGNRDEE